MHAALKTIRTRLSLAAFRRSEAGNTTIEAVFWIPFFFFFLLGGGQLAMIFHGQTMTQHIAQEATRAYSVGRLASGAEVGDYVRDRLSEVSGEVSVSTTVTDGLITTVVRVPARDFGGPLQVFASLANLQVQAVSQQVKEL